ncbi:putative EB module-containing protein 1 [Homarus americanus]|uniref:Putative EB module-containing protein 1 n=1 Tax=Homarus americanus TaxID=6706 RepID=A0A8J5K7I8_HOMAM|nr:putative EB module-containing protein 1 [Homarus americanus]
MLCVGVVVGVVMVLGGTIALDEKLYQRYKNNAATGSIAVVKEFSSRLHCGLASMQLSGEGYNLKTTAEDKYECTIFSVVDGVLNDTDNNFYCGVCKEVGESCTEDWECFVLTEGATCVLGTCDCDLGYDPTDGVCEVGEDCEADVQCLATSKGSECDPTNKCACAQHFYPNATGNGCLIDYAAYGFVAYNGRWVFHLPGLLPISWDLSFVLCDSLFSTMFKPRDATVGGENYLKWSFGSPTASNTPITNCVGMVPSILFVSPESINFGICGLILPLASTFCEADF